MPKLEFPRAARWVKYVFASIAVTAAGIGGAACSEDPSDPAAAEFGSYTLLSVNGQSLPFAVTTALGNIVVQGATLRLIESGSGNPIYEAAVSGTDDGAQTVLLGDAGSYARAGNTLTFSSLALPGLTYIGNVESEDVVTLTVPGASIGVATSVSLRFQK